MINDNATDAMIKNGFLDGSDNTRDGIWIGESADRTTIYGVNITNCDRGIGPSDTANYSGADDALIKDR